MSTNEKPPEAKLETALSLIDFDTDFEPPAPSVAIQTPSTTPQPVPQPASSSNDNWASFDAAPSAPSLNVSQPPSNGNTLDSILSQLAVNSSVPGQTSIPSNGPVHLGHSTSQIFAPFPNEHSSEQVGISLHDISKNCIKFCVESVIWLCFSDFCYSHGTQNLHLMYIGQ